MTRVALHNETSNVIPADDYLAELFDYQVLTSQRSGEPYINIDFRINGGDYDGRHVYGRLSLQPQSLWTVKRMLLAMGLTKEDFMNFDKDGNPQEVEIEDLLDKVKAESPMAIISVVIRPPQKNPQGGDDYPEKNDIRTYKSASSWGG